MSTGSSGLRKKLAPVPTEPPMPEIKGPDLAAIGLLHWNEAWVRNPEAMKRYQRFVEFRYAPKGPPS